MVEGERVRPAPGAAQLARDEITRVPGARGDLLSSVKNPIVSSVVDPLVGGLTTSFVDMSTATISQTIRLDTTMPISFTLPLQEETKVVLVEAVPLTILAQFTLPGGGGQINGNVSLELPARLELPVALDLAVDVDQTIPVVMDVPVQIPLQETDLGGPFNTLRGLFEPLDKLIKGLPANNDELFGRVTQSNNTRAGTGYGRSLTHNSP